MNPTQLWASLIACVAAYGAHLLYTSVAMRWTGLGPGPSAPQLSRRRFRPHLAKSSGRPLVAAVVGTVVTFLLFGAPLPSLLGGALAAVLTAVSTRAELERRQERVAAAWPAILEETRVLAGAGGHPIPHALFEAGQRTPTSIRESFGAAQREWQTSTDFARALAVLKAELAEASSDVVCETLLIAHQVGGTGVDRRLEALIDDRLRELDLRRDAMSRQAGARFARRFVLIVPVGMAFVGMSLGTGRAAYQGRGAQLTVALALALIGGCWVWAGRILRLPRPERVFT
jgi:tight adherence protein B